MIVEKSPPMPLSSLWAENNKVQKQLYNKINEARELGDNLAVIFSLLREKLKKNEAKSNNFGLAGSLLFKLSSDNRKNEHSLLPYKRKNDSKLLIYDILRNKYDSIMREKKKEE